MFVDDGNALADEDHTHHLTPQEYYHYKSNWWPTSSKTGSNIVSVEHRLDFKQALSTLQQLTQKEEGSFQTSANSCRNQQWGTEFFFFFFKVNDRSDGHLPT